MALGARRPVGIAEKRASGQRNPEPSRVSGAHAPGRAPAAGAFYLIRRSRCLQGAGRRLGPSPTQTESFAPRYASTSPACSPSISRRCAQNGIVPFASSASWKARSENFAPCSALQSARSFISMSLPAV